MDQKDVDMDFIKNLLGTDIDECFMPSRPAESSSSATPVVDAAASPSGGSLVVQKKEVSRARPQEPGEMQCVKRRQLNPPPAAPLAVQSPAASHAAPPRRHQAGSQAGWDFGLTLFFQSVESSVRRLPPTLQLTAKAKITDIITRLELSLHRKRAAMSLPSPGVGGPRPHQPRPSTSQLQRPQQLPTVTSTFGASTRGHQGMTRPPAYLPPPYPTNPPPAPSYQQFDQTFPENPLFKDIPPKPKKF